MRMRSHEPRHCPAKRRWSGSAASAATPRPSRCGVSETPAGECGAVDVAAVTAAANSADQVVLALGECRCMSGEAESRTTLDLPGKQQEIVDAVASTAKPFVVVLFNGRPLTLTDVAAKSPAI